MSERLAVICKKCQQQVIRNLLANHVGTNNTIAGSVNAYLIHDLSSSVHKTTQSCLVWSLVLIVRGSRVLRSSSGANP